MMLTKDERAQSSPRRNANSSASRPRRPFAHPVSSAAGRRRVPSLTPVCTRFGPVHSSSPSEHHHPHSKPVTWPRHQRTRQGRQVPSLFSLCVGARRHPRPSHVKAPALVSASPLFPEGNGQQKTLGGPVIGVSQSLCPGGLGYEATIQGFQTGFSNVIHLAAQG